MPRRAPRKQIRKSRTLRVPAAMRVGDQGAGVKRLQRALSKAGFSPGTIDGDFGPATRAAVMAFQASEGLLVDGIAGPRTLAALKLAKSAQLPSAIPGFTPRVVSEMFPFTPVDNIKRNLPPVLKALKADNMVDKPMVLMALATIRAETESFEPIAEGRSRYNSSPAGHPFDLYDNRRDLGNTGPPDGERYRGRGYVQLTGRFNYRQYGQAIGLGDKLEKDPDLASRADIAGRLLSAFLKSKERRIKEALVAGDLTTARKLVNGGSHGLDRFTDAYRRGERLLS
jgi:peptidoglycan L-alanyl-D-glutamate endopeptidase CwlK